jgi:hypothetical protein
MSKKRSFQQAQLDDYYESRRMRKLNEEGVVSDYKWLIEKCSDKAEQKSLMKPVKDPKPLKRERTRLYMLMATRRKVVQLRFGDDPLVLPRKTHHSIKDISLRVGHKYETVKSFLYRFKLTGQYTVERKKRGHVKLLPCSIKYLCSIETLTKWRHMTMQQRCKKINDEMKVCISRTLLFNIYKENAIIRRQPSYKFYRNLRSPFQ